MATRDDKGGAPAGFDEKALFERIDKLNVWTRGTARAPHKPLLLLLVLARLQRGESRIVRYERDVRDQLRKLLIDFGPPRRTHRPENPFWYLRSDELWEIPDEDLAKIRGRGQVGGPTDRLLRDVNAHGGLPPAAHQLLSQNPQLVTEATRRLLDGHFPSTLHESILDAVGLSLTAHERVDERRARDPEFRQRVLTAYERRCAICDFDMRIEDSLVALDAAHIRWHARGGPDEVPNGLALCTFHHVTFDRGAIGLERASNGFRVLVSDAANGQSQPFRQLLDCRGQRLRAPQRREQRPHPDFVDWHRRQVFRGRPRDMEVP